MAGAMPSGTSAEEPRKGAEPMLDGQKGQGAPTPPDRTRLGPRPLQQHLALAAMPLLICSAVSTRWRSGSPASKRPAEGRAPAAPLGGLPESVDPEAVAAALDAEARRRFDAFLTGVERYRRHPYRRTLADPPVRWQEGTTRLLDYGAGVAHGAPALLVVPSLVNRAYVLDLAPECSLLRYLAGRGLRPFLVDWDGPGPVERAFTLTDYIARRLEAALDAAVREAGGPVAVVGYCMGGLLGLALALRRAGDVRGLACLATPWDFHAGQTNRARLAGALVPVLEPVLAALGELPVDLVQMLFALLDPYGVVRKFRDFAALDEASAQARRFVAVEDWLNDGVPLAAPVARECLAGWYGDNAPARGEWQIAGEAVRPGDLRMPSLVVLPDRDRIVPPDAAAVLAKALPGAARLRPAAGHVGMVVGRDAEARLWRPLAEWLLRLPDGARQRTAL